MVPAILDGKDRNAKLTAIETVAAMTNSQAWELVACWTKKGEDAVYINALLQSFASHKATLDKDILAGFLQGNVFTVKLSALNYIEKLGDTNDLPLIEPLTKSRNVSLAHAAIRVMQTLKGSAP